MRARPRAGCRAWVRHRQGLPASPLEDSRTTRGTRTFGTVYQGHGAKRDRKIGQSVFDGRAGATWPLLTRRWCTRGTGREGGESHKVFFTGGQVQPVPFSPVGGVPGARAERGENRTKCFSRAGRCNLVPAHPSGHREPGFSGPPSARFRKPGFSLNMTSAIQPRRL